MYQANYLTTISHPYFVARGLAGADTLVTLASEGDFAQLPSDTLDLLRDDIVTPKDAPVFPELIANGISLILAGTHASDADNKNLNWRLLLWRNSNGPAELVADGTAKTGTQQVIIYPHGVATTTANWCDTIVISNNYWIKEIKSTSTTGNDSVAKLWLDVAGYRYVKMEITLPGGGSDIVNSAVFYSRW